MSQSAENDAWGDDPADVLLCLYDDDIGACCLPYEHNGEHVTRA